MMGPFLSFFRANIQQHRQCASEKNYENVYLTYDPFVQRSKSLELNRLLQTDHVSQSHRHMHWNPSPIDNRQVYWKIFLQVCSTTNTLSIQHYITDACLLFQDVKCFHEYEFFKNFVFARTFWMTSEKILYFLTVNNQRSQFRGRCSALSYLGYRKKKTIIYLQKQNIDSC